MIARNPKVIMGYSDLTGLLNAIHTKTGLVTFHGYTLVFALAVAPLCATANRATRMP